MEIKNKKMMFVMIFLVLALVSATAVEGIDGIFGWKLGKSNIGDYFAGRMIANYIIVFSLVFIIVYFVLFSKENRPEGVLLYVFLIALFALSVAITIFITKGKNVFIWDIAQLDTLKWVFKPKTIVNAVIVAGLCIVVKTYFVESKEEGKKGTIAAAFIIILITSFAVSMINYSAAPPKTKLPEGVTYKADEKYIDRWIWQYPQVSKMRVFLLGDQPDGTYEDDRGEEKQGILSIGRNKEGVPNGKGLPAFFLGSLLLIWLFTHFEYFKGQKIWQYGLPIFLAALLANQRYTRAEIMGYAWWAVIIVLNSSFRKSWGKDRPGTAFGLAYAIVQTVYVAIVGEGYIFPGSTSFLGNFVIGLGVGFLWDLLIGQGGVWDAQAKRQREAIDDIADKWEKKGAVKAAKYGLGKALGVIPWVKNAKWLKKWMSEFIPAEEELLGFQKEAEKTLKELIEEEKKTGGDRTAAVIARIATLRTDFNDQIQRIESINRKIARLRST